MIIEKPVVIIDAHIPYIKGALEPYADVKYLKGADINASDVTDASALIVRTRTKCNATLLENSKVKAIASATIGFDHIDTDYCKSSNIAWSNAPGCNSGSVLQYVAAATMLLLKKEGVHPSKLTFGIVGVGHVGKKVADFAKKLGFKVLLNDPPRARAEGDDKFVSLGRIARKCDIITFHVPLNRDGADKTYHLFNEKFANKLERKPYIINSSRGEIAETNALKKAKKENKVKDLILDVWENEPGIDTDLLDMALIATPHIAGYSADGKKNGTEMSVEKVANVLNLPLKDWKATNVPLPQETLFKLNCATLSAMSVLRKIIWFTYDIKQESKNFKKEYRDFERLRNEYPLRREFFVYTIKLKNCRKEVKELVKSLGFQLAE